MPIRAKHRWLYPIDWPQISSIVRFVRFVRAEGHCERCRRPHGRYVAQLGADGVWWDSRGRELRRQPAFVALEAVRMTRKPVYLATAHLNHDPIFGEPRRRNRTMLCRRCHMSQDTSEHRHRRWWNVSRRHVLSNVLIVYYQ